MVANAVRWEPSSSTIRMRPEVAGAGSNTSHSTNSHRRMRPDSGHAGDFALFCRPLSAVNRGQRCRLGQLVVRISKNPVDVVTLYEKDPGARSQLDALGHPDPVIETSLLHGNVRAAQHARQKQTHRERLGHVSFDLDPSEVLLIDPELTLHLGHQLAVRAVRAIAGSRSRPKDVGRPAVDYLFADELEVEAIENFPD